MPKPVTIELSEDQRVELQHMRVRAEKTYLRERAAAILKIAAGESGRQVAFYGLLQKRRTDTVYAWVHRYREKGVAGLKIKSGRGRKPAFSPSVPGREEG